MERKHVLADPENSPDTVAETLGLAAGGAGAGIMAGQRAKTANKAKLAQANMMEIEGASQQEIFEATGWFRAADGKWRFEIDDRASRFSPVMEDTYLPGTNKTVVGGQAMADKRTQLGAVLQHPELYRAYPEMLNVPVSIRPGDPSVRGLAHPATGVELDYDLVPDEAHKTLLHELQHMVQFHEGHALGGSPEQMSSLVPEQDPYNAYRRLAGEVEARNVAERFAMGRAGYTHGYTDFGEGPELGWASDALAARRPFTPGLPTLSEDIPSADQLIYYLQSGGLPFPDAKARFGNSSEGFASLLGKILSRIK